MYYRFATAILAVLVGYTVVSAQELIPSTTTAAELWNPWTWFWPYAKAAAEGYRDYYDKAQKATNELYQQIYKTNAFPWVTGNWSSTASQSGQTGSEGQANQGNSTQSSGGSSDTAKVEANENTTGTETQVEGNVENDGTVNAEGSAAGEEVQV